MTTPSHQPGCTLYVVHWLRHATAAAGRLAAEQADADELDMVDRKSAELLLDAMAHFAELPEWETVTLLDIAEHARPTDNDDRFTALCTCREGPPTIRSRAW